MRRESRRESRRRTEEDRGGKRRVRGVACMWCMGMWYGFCVLGSGFWVLCRAVGRAMWELG